MKRSSTGALVSAILLLGSAANADDKTPTPASTEVRTIEAPDPASLPKRGFGSPGTVVLDDVLGLTADTGSALGMTSLLHPIGWLFFRDAHTDLPSGTIRSTSIGVAPSMDVFVAERLSLGGQLTLSSDQSYAGSDMSSVTACLSPRIGMAFPLTDSLALWTRARGSLAVGHSVMGPQYLGGGQMTDSTRSTLLAWGVSADAKLVANLGRWVALTFGPTLSYGKTGKTDLVGGGSSRSVLLAATGGIAIVL